MHKKKKKKTLQDAQTFRTFGQELSVSLIALETCTRDLLRVDKKMDLHVNYSVRIEVDLLKKNKKNKR